MKPQWEISADLEFLASFTSYMRQEVPWRYTTHWYVHYDDRSDMFEIGQKEAWSVAITGPLLKEIQESDGDKRDDYYHMLLVWIVDAIEL